MNKASPTVIGTLFLNVVFHEISLTLYCGWHSPGAGAARVAEVVPAGDGGGAGPRHGGAHALGHGAARHPHRGGHVRRPHRRHARTHRVRGVQARLHRGPASIVLYYVNRERFYSRNTILKIFNI